MTDQSSGTTYQRGPHRVVIERACPREDCRAVMSSLTSRELMRRGGRPSERAITFRARPRTKGLRVVRRQLVENEPQSQRTAITGASRSGGDESS